MKEAKRKPSPGKCKQLRGLLKGLVATCYQFPIELECPDIHEEAFGVHAEDLAEIMADCTLKFTKDFFETLGEFVRVMHALDAYEEEFGEAEIDMKGLMKNCNQGLRFVFETGENISNSIDPVSSLGDDIENVGY